MTGSSEDIFIRQPKGPQLALRVRTPDREGPYPVIVMGHGLGTHKEDNIYQFSDAFVEQGYAVVNFDYATWGASLGTPRHQIIVWNEYRDFQAVVAWVRTQENKFDADRIVVWGSSFGGMHTTRILAEDKKIRAGIAQCPCVDARAAAFMKPIGVNLRLGFWAVMDVLGSAVGAGPVFVDNVKYNTKGGGVALMMGEDVASKWSKIIVQSKHKDPELENKVAARSILSFPVSRPAARASRITAPYLVVVPEWDTVAPLKAAEMVAKAAQKGEMVRVTGGHFDLYPGGPGYEKNLKAQLEFLARVCPVDKSPKAKL